MKRRSIADAFARAARKNRAALLAFLTAGHPSLALTPSLIGAACAGGADIIELGFPYSDPLADGPIIQASSQRALNDGVTFDAVIELAMQLTTQGPLVAFSYYNPLYARGLSRCAQDLARAGFAGAIVPDLPLEESSGLAAALHEEGLALTLLVSPTTPADRAAEIAARSDGFVYVVSRTGVTGTHAGVGAALRDRVESLRVATGKPLAVGFGVATPQDAQAVASVADGVVVGSALVAAAEGSEPAQAIEALCSALSEACARVSMAGAQPR